ncbi:FkbM family methyltransferase [Henriciella sp.]|uniref:FkbM family methyltransferase n=1 Tax=Henriciella sp. TaxID=1968823 RepID=UPI00263A1CBD|nr:FkbM family methyltransferase [Henriciella sp.]
MRVVLYPALSKAKDFNDQYFRALWYLAPFADQISSIDMPTTQARKPGKPPNYLDSSLKSLEGTLTVNTPVAKTAEDLEALVEASDLIIAWSVDSKKPFARIPGSKGKKIAWTDQNNFQYGASLYLKIAENFPEFMDESLKRSRRIFRDIHSRCANQKGYLFGTGPNLSQANNFDFSDGTPIACNSMVRNHQLMDRLTPPLIVVGDPIFHAGPSSYAAAFRNDLIRALDKYDSHLVVPMRDYHIYRTHLPERFANKICAIPFADGDTPNLNLVSEFQVTTTANILTLFLLPLAATLFEEISIAGCDGRPVDQNTYFWGHDKASQINEEMSRIQLAHPAFFNVDYDDYYSTHCKTLETWLSAMEERGKAIKNMTSSYIPALSKRGPDAAEDQKQKSRGRKKPLISIVMPVHNGEKHLESAIKSVRTQDIDDWELLVINDGSTDSSVDIVKRLAEEDSRIKLTTVEQGGVSRARNKGLELAEGSYIGFVDADDLLDPRSLKARLDVLQSGTGTQMVHGWVDVVGNDGKSMNLGVGTKSDICFFDAWRNPAHLNTVTGEAKLLKQFRFNEKVAHGEDWLFLGQILRSGVTSRFVPDGGARWRFWGSSSTSKDLSSHFESLQTVIDWLTTPINDDAIPRQYRNGLIGKTSQDLEAAAKRSVFISKLLEGDTDFCRSVIEDVALSTKNEEFGRIKWLRTIEFAAARKFSTPPSKLKATGRDLRDRILDASKSLDLRRQIPQLGAVLSEVFGEQLPQTSTVDVPAADEATLKDIRDAEIKKLPKYLRMGIFLPTDRVSLEEQIRGIHKIANIYDSGEIDTHRSLLKDLRNGRKRKRCFIIGNGPSLKKTDLSPLKNEDTFVTNGFFLKMPELDWTPTYYVVEDHLVAEDRKKEINNLHGPTKLFPAYLRYCLNPDKDTIFFNHRPRVSFPDGFDFSFDADDHTFAGGTVTFTCMELAAFLGYEEIYLIGVDASYAIPKDATASGPGRVKELDMKSDDPNHFHPDYFGKGKRWHEPNVDVMLKAYEEARARCDERGQIIVNATIGGKLEVFPRTDYESLFDPGFNLPKTLVIDLTRIGDPSATGALKAELLGDCPKNRILQLHGGPFNTIGVYPGNQKPALNNPLVYGYSELEQVVRAFAPDVILYRPTPNTPALHDAAKHILNMTGLPLVTWIMDDWPTAYLEDDLAKGRQLLSDFQKLARDSAYCLSISDYMSEAFEERYGVPFIPVANGVRPEDWEPATKKAPEDPVIVRYAGSLAENMTLSTLLMIAEAIEGMVREGKKISFEIKTRQVWYNRVEPLFRHLKHTDFIVGDLPIEDYRNWLSGADITVIGYNFDDKSKRYIQYSLANKLPECLASGATLLAVGPDDVATIKKVRETGVGVVVDQNDPNAITKTIDELAASPERRYALATKAQELAFTSFNLNSTRKKLVNVLLKSKKLSEAAKLTYPRSAGAHVDETEVVSRMLSDRKGPGHVMIDVGAHFGTSARYFASLGWTVHCFEPDPENRKKLVERVGKMDNVSIDTRGVSDKKETGVSFFTSPESTGISGLSAFRDTHQESAKVDLTTTAEIIRERNLKHIDFLKIDVEGFDFSVLKGVPWNTLKPDVVECEFEDAKTVPLGHTWKDIANYLRARGYHVYVSEWHPIIRYGIPHDWSRVYKYPGPSMDSSAWGNFLAFREDPGYDAVSNAFNALLKFRQKSKPEMLKKTPNKPALPVVKAPAPSSTAPQPSGMLQRRLAGIRRFAGVAATHFWARKSWTLPLAGVVMLAFLLTFLPPFAAAGSVWRLTLLFGLISIGLLYVTFRTFSALTALRQELQALQTQSQNPAALKLQQHRIDSLGRSVSKIEPLVGDIADIKSRIGRLNATSGHADSLTRRLGEEFSDYAKSTEHALESIQVQLKATDERASQVGKLKTLIDQKGEFISQLQTRVNAVEAADYTAQISELRNAHAELEDSKAKLSAALDELRMSYDKLDSMLDDFSTKTSEKLGQLSDRGDQTREKLDQLSQWEDEAEKTLAGLTEGAQQTGTKLANLIETDKETRETIASLSKWKQFNNAAWFQHFNRELGPDHIQIFEKDWPKRLSIPISKASLGYMAAKACDVEKQLDGRLATSIEDILLRTLVARSIKGKSAKILEIGTLFGTGAAIMFDAMVNHFDHVHFTLLDPLEGYYNASQADILTGQPVDERTLRRNLQRVGMTDDNFNLIKTLSTQPEALEEAAKEQYDLLVIDGDHSYAGVKTDFENYAHLVKLGGYIIFDDYNSKDWPDVQEYVDNELADSAFISRVGASWRTCVYRVVKAPATTTRRRKSTTPARKAAEKSSTKAAAGSQG